MKSFKDLRIVDNFYQTSSFFPMPTILVSTLDEAGNTSVGAYSLCFPYYVAGKSYYAMILECRNSSNTAQHILAGSKVALNFLPHHKKYFKETVRLGFPGDTSKEKMKDFAFTLMKGQAEGKRPEIIEEAFQVFECTWDDQLENAYECVPGSLEGYEAPYKDFNGITSKMGAHFILKIDKILMRETYYDAILEGVKARDFPQIPVDYGYRDNTHFWFAPTKMYRKEAVPAPKEIDISTVRYAADRTDPTILFTDDACKRLSRVPRIFLKAALDGCVKWAKEHDVFEIDVAALEQIQDKRSKDKKK